MLGSLFVKECTQTAKSLIYWLIVILMAVFFFSQMGDMDIAGKPLQGGDDYGLKSSTDEQLVMESTLGKLAEEYNQGSYSTYPIGFYKSVKLNEKEEKRVEEILKETLGFHNREEIEEALKGYGQGKTGYVQEIKIAPQKWLTAETFEKYMKEIDDMLGGGSSYSAESLKGGVSVPMTYEDALKEYETMVEDDHFTRGYARLFCDYMGIVLAILPVFLAVTRGLRDKRASMQELIAVRRSSSLTIIVSRYVSMIVMLMIPVLLLSAVPLAECVKYAADKGIVYDAFAFVKYSAGWLLPTVMIPTAVGLVFTELTDTAAGILVQGVWWFLTLFSGISKMDGGHYGFSLVPRHNSAGNYQLFQDGFSQLAVNRICYVMLALLLTAVSVWIYSQKRKGRLNLYDKIFRNRKRKSKA